MMRSRSKRLLRWQLILGLFLVVVFGVLYLPSERDFDSVTDHGSSERHTSVSGNKTLVVLLGNLRGGERAWETLEKHVLDVNDADLALLIGDTRDAFKNASLFARSEYIWRVTEYDDWADAIDLIDGPSWRNDLLPLVYEKSWVLGGIKGYDFVGSGSIGLMMRWFLAQRLQQERLIEKYDHFVVTRSDHYYVCDHRKEFNAINSGVLMVPKGEDYGGITDRHLVVGRDNLLKALNVLPPILRNPHQYVHLFDATFGNNLERLLAYRWMEEGLTVQRFDRIMFVCGEAGDETRTTQLGMETPDGVRLKYAKEYVASYMTCGKSPGIID